MRLLRHPARRSWLTIHPPGFVLAGLTTAALLLFSLSCSPPPVRHITLIHHNDFHAADLPHDVVGEDGGRITLLGAAGLKGLAEAVEDTAAATLWLHAGDEYSGGVLSTLTEGGSQIALARRMGYDVFELGNHEFDYGPDRAAAFRDSAGIPVLGGANLFYENGRPFARSTLDTTIGGVPMRIIGLLPPDLIQLTGKHAHEGLRVTDPDSAVRRLLPRKSRLAVVLSHMGFQRDSLLATRVPEVDVIIGGHSHTVLRRPRLVGPGGEAPGEALTGDGERQRLPGTVIAQAGAHGAWLGVLSLDVRRGDVVSAAGRLLPNDGSLAPPDSALAAFVEAMDRRLASRLDEPIATVAEPLTRSWNRESAMGRWQTDAFRAATGAEIAFQNPGGLRRDWLPGPLTLRDLWETNPFSNTLIVFEMNGEELKRALEHIAGGSFEGLLVSGLTATFDLAEHTVREIMVGGRPLDPEATYRVVTNNYVFGHFEDFFGMPQGERKFNDTGLIDRDALAQAAREQGTIRAPKDVRIRYVE